MLDASTRNRPTQETAKQQKEVNISNPIVARQLWWLCDVLRRCLALELKEVADNIDALRAHLLTAAPPAILVDALASLLKQPSFITTHLAVLLPAILPLAHRFQLYLDEIALLKRCTDHDFVALHRQQHLAQRRGVSSSSASAPKQLLLSRFSSSPERKSKEVRSARILRQIPPETEHTASV